MKRINHILKEILRFSIDTIFSYIWAIMLCIPIFNVIVLRGLMKDSRFFCSHVDESELEKKIKNYKRKNK